MYKLFTPTADDGLSAFFPEDEAPAAEPERVSPTTTVSVRWRWPDIRTWAASPLGLLALALTSGAVGGVITVSLGMAPGAPLAAAAVPADAVVDALPPARPVVETEVVTTHMAAASAPARAARPAAVAAAPVRQPAPPPRPPVAPSGFITVASAVPMEITLNGTVIGSSATPKLRIAAGTHTVELSNPALGYRVEQAVTIAAGRTASISLDTPRGVLHVNAMPWGEVWVDGRRVGETPIGNVSLPIGEHELVARHPTLGEQRRTFVVGVGQPTRLGVEFDR